MKTTDEKEALRNELLAQVKRTPAGTRISALGQRLRKRSRWKKVRDVDIKTVVLPMVMGGTLKYTPDLKIRLAKPKRKTKLTR